MRIGGDEIRRQWERALHAGEGADRSASEISRQDPLRGKRSIEGAVRIIERSLAQNVGAGKGRLGGMHHIGAQLIEEDSVAAAHARPAVAEDVPRKAHARSEVVHIVKTQLAVSRQPWIAREEHKRQRVRVQCGTIAETRDVHIGVPVIRLVPCKVRLIAQTEREREAGLDLKLVLEKELVLPGPRRTPRLSKQDAELVETAKEKIRHGVAAIDCSEADAAGLSELGVQLPIDLMQLITPLERVPVMNPAPRIAEVPVLVVLPVRV